MTPSVLASVGTDHHRFDRLVAWLDRFAADHPGVSCFVQSGTSNPPRVADGQAYLPHAELRVRLTDATVVVSHGGPATIMDARAAGHRPVVLPRNPAFGEHVDDHQMRFAAWMAERGQILAAADEDELTRLVEDALANPERVQLGEANPETAQAIRRFGDLIDGMLA